MLHAQSVRAPLQSGGVYKLRIAYGALPVEERFKINEHIIQTLVMLETLPPPPNLCLVPECSGIHHETLIGTVYPRRLTAAELTGPPPIMAIADIIEAPTAYDRPDKKANILSECIKILSFIKNDKHIDSDLFALFLTSRMYKAYAELCRFVDQIHDVDIARSVS